MPAGWNSNDVFVHTFETVRLQSDRPHVTPCAVCVYFTDFYVLRECFICFAFTFFETTYFALVGHTWLSVGPALVYWLATICFRSVIICCMLLENLFLAVLVGSA